MSNGTEDGMHGGWWSGHKVVDPSELESRFSVEDGLGFLDTASEELSDESSDQLDRVRDILDQLPPCEADFIDLYFFRRRKQTDIPAIFGVSQPTVCYRLQRATARARYLLSLPEVLDGEIKSAMVRVLDDPLDVEVMTLMFETTCQSEVAKRLGISQGKVRHRFIRALSLMGDLRQISDETQVLLGMGEEDRASQFDAEDDSVWQDEMRRTTSQLLGDDVDVELHLHMLLHGNVSAAMRTFQLTRHMVQKRYEEATEAVSWYTGIEKYIHIFRKVSENLNILREVQRPSNERITHVLAF
jgi:DNA-directed RNA polymerase specialized sigma24 family protein